MRYFYIDTENFSDYSFIKNWNIGKNDIIIFFVSENTGSVKLKLLSEMYSNSVNIIFEDVVTGEKNAMDSQIIACLSINIANNKNYYTEHYIVSDDKDYHPLLDYMYKKFKLMDIYIIKPRYDTLIQDILVKKEILSDFHNSISNVVPQNLKIHIYPTYKNKFLIKKYKKEIRNNLSEFIKESDKIYEKHNKNDFKLYKELKNKYGNTNGVKIYKFYKEELNKRIIINEDNSKLENELSDIIIIDDFLKK